MASFGGSIVGFHWNNLAFVGKDIDLKVEKVNH